MLDKYGTLLPKKFSSYHEPFFGGGAMFVWAYEKNPDCDFFINDINQHIIGIYKAIKNDVNTFLSVLEKMQNKYIPLPSPADLGSNKQLEKKHKLSVKGRTDWKSVFDEEPSRRHYYFMLRDEYAFDYQKWSDIEEAAVLYFLMKTGFNGVWQVNSNTAGRFGTPCGLLNQKDKVYDEENISLWSKALQKCTITSGDFKQTLSDVKKDSFVFLDPPYRGCFADYGTESDDQFQETVIQFLNDSKSKGAYSLLSNRHIGDDFFVDRQGDNKIEYFDVTYTVGRRKKTEDGFEAKKAVEILMIGDGRF